MPRARLAARACAICRSLTTAIRTVRPKKPTAVGALVEGILESNATWVDRDGQQKPVTLDDIIIITPYNAQVFEIQQRLPGARVGTVDKFQGQEAPIAIYSTATSSRADAPRGMEFLYSLNRLNVATSRAKCISIMVGSPELFEDRVPHAAPSPTRQRLLPVPGVGASDRPEIVGQRAHPGCAGNRVRLRHCRALLSNLFLMPPHVRPPPEMITLRIGPDANC